MWTLLENPDSAIATYQEALALDPFQVEWRLELVRILRQQGQIHLALEQALFGATLAPKRADLRKLIQELRHIEMMNPAPKPSESSRT